MRYVAGQNVRWLWSLAVLLGAVRWAEAGPLDPDVFALSGTGTFPTLVGTYSINTSGTLPTIAGLAGTIIGPIYPMDSRLRFQLDRNWLERDL